MMFPYRFRSGNMMSDGKDICLPCQLIFATDRNTLDMFLRCISMMFIYTSGFIYNNVDDFFWASMSKVMFDSLNSTTIEDICEYSKLPQGCYDK